MVIDDFKQIKHLQNKIDYLVEKKRQVESISLSIKLDGMPRPKYSLSDPTGRDGTSAAEIARNIDDLTEELTARVNEAYRYIDSLDDIQLQLALAYRFIEGLEWGEVADRIGGNDKSVSMMVYRHFDKTC